ncbi:ABC transporter ATP-binding protein [Acetobacteraceae bacterium]|nr:ABC transporter ATP-binding protein [Acetobacteraceae bacterium]
MKADAVLSLRNLSRIFHSGEQRLEILREASLEIRPGELVGLVGPSGIGKSTLLHIAGLLESPNSGEVMIAGKCAHQLNDYERTILRRDSIGFVFQFHHLLPEFTALENVMLPALTAGKPIKEAEERAAYLLEMLFVRHRMLSQPGKMSGGERQRVAIARALINQPVLLLADEPTGNLDVDTAEQVLESISNIVRKEKAGALIVTHNVEIAQRMDKNFSLHQGKVILV